MNKILFKKAQSFVDSLRVKFDNTLASVLVYMVYAICNKSFYPEIRMNDFRRDAEGLLPKAVVAIGDILRHFDALFEAGHHHTEVYLGRDGIYPYLARRAQLWVRRKAGIKVPRVVYLVYSTAMKDNLDPSQSIQYLAQFGITPDQCRGLVFYDTGFSGSIPERILCDLNAEFSDMPSRIRMTAFTSDLRSMCKSLDIETDERNIPIKGLRKFLREYNSNMALRRGIGALLENMPKTEESANPYLVMANGKLRHIANQVPSQDKERWKFHRAFLVAYFYRQEEKALKMAVKLSEWGQSSWQTVEVGKVCKTCRNFYNVTDEAHRHNIVCDVCGSWSCEEAHNKSFCNCCGLRMCSNTEHHHNKNCDLCNKRVCTGQNHHVHNCYSCGHDYCSPLWMGSSCPTCNDATPVADEIPI